MWISFELSDMSDTSFCSCMRKGVVNEMKLVLGAENLKVMIKRNSFKINDFPFVFCVTGSPYLKFVINVPYIG